MASNAGNRQEFLEYWKESFILTIDQVPDGRWIALVRLITDDQFVAGLFDDAEEAKQAGIAMARKMIDRVSPDRP